MIKNNLYFNGNLGNTQSYLLGFLLADGGFIKSNSNFLSLESKDKCQIELLKSELNATNKITIIKSKGDKIICGRKCNTSDLYRIGISSSQIISDLKSLGVSLKNREFKYKDSRIQTIDYLRGFLDGDGCITSYIPKNKKFKSLRIFFVSGNNNIISSIYEYLNSLELNVHKPIKRKDNSFSIQLAKISSLKLCNMIYDNAKDFLYRKKSVYLDILV